MICYEHNSFFNFWGDLFNLHPGLKGGSNFKSFLKKASYKYQRTYIMQNSFHGASIIVENSNLFNPFFSQSVKSTKLHAGQTNGPDI